MADSPLIGASGPLGYQIKADGAEIDSTLELLSAHAHAEIGRIPECRLVFQDGSPATQEFPLADADTFKPGAEVSVAAHFGPDTPKVIFEGMVVASRLRINGSRGSRLEVICRSQAVKLAQVRRTAFFAEQTDDNVMSSIAGDGGLTATVDSVTGAARDQVQHDCTDWDFIRLLADRNGLMVLADGKTLTVKAFDDTTAAVMTLTFGTDILDFDAEISAAGALDAASGGAWDAASQEMVTGDASAPADGKWSNLTRGTLARVMGGNANVFATPVPLGAADLTANAGARLTQSEWARIVGRVSYPGSALARPGDVIELTGLGDRFGGSGLVTAVTHRLEDGAWTSEAMLGRPAGWRSEDGAMAGPAASGLATPLAGMHVGKVLQVHEDPDSNARIKVSLPALAADGVELWARFAAPYAGDGTGLMFLPETGDEVVVGFLAEDPAYPVVLGALHSAALARPVEADEANTLKVIKTKSELRVSFDDDKKILTLETPGGAKVMLDDDAGTLSLADQNGNTIEMSSSGVKIDTPKDLTLSATGKIDIAATGDASLSGMNVSAEADVELTAKGNASAEVSASGTMTVKGAMVMIN